jgi:hypothetical protein
MIFQNAFAIFWRKIGVFTQIAAIYAPTIALSNFSRTFPSQ